MPGGLPGAIGFISGIVIMTMCCLFCVGCNVAKRDRDYESTQEERQPMQIHIPMEGKFLLGGLRRPAGQDAMVEGNALTIERPSGDFSVI